ncbi:competence type IV pilus minor pilin ComGD [Enterococcus sp.]|jgi:competence protein ComGD|uniref:competence type IV pilus minor pilin ComGD n=1 Tax=Enterococcus sp. TaxID=35783 RepID=UPI0025BB4AC2|nr:competence type IV pilus minor pilin ComGD [Enterococcus sp.]
MRSILPIATSKRRGGRRGFTMLESLIVLLVIAIFIFLPLLVIDHYQTQFEVLGFCARLEKGLAVAQQTAIIDARETKVAYSDTPVPTVYFHSTITGEIKMEPLEVPPQLVVRAFPVLTFTSQSGNYTQMASLRFEWIDQQKMITYKFLFGSGRYDKIIE